MTAKRIAVKRYIVNLSEEERDRLNTLIHTGKHPARQLTRARILLKADSSAAGEGWSDSQIATALDTSVDNDAVGSNFVAKSQCSALTGFHSSKAAGVLGIFPCSRTSQRTIRCNLR